jgi:protein subunit release factor B
MDDYQIPETDAALLAECDVQTFRATGPGGQGVNTTDSAVRLVHRPTGIRVVCRQQRSQLLNKLTCLERLRAKLVDLQTEAVPRVPTAEPRRVRARVTDSKVRRGGVKRLRKPPTVDEE